jgi:hypothetical protein
MSPAAMPAGGHQQPLARQVGAVVEGQVELVAVVGDVAGRRAGVDGDAVGCERACGQRRRLRFLGRV